MGAAAHVDLGDGQVELGVAVFGEGLRHPALAEEVPGLDGLGEPEVGGGPRDLPLEEHEDGYEPHCELSLVMVVIINYVSPVESSATLKETADLPPSLIVNLNSRKLFVADC